MVSCRVGSSLGMVVLGHMMMVVVLVMVMLMVVAAVCWALSTVNSAHIFSTYNAPGC